MGIFSCLRRDQKEAIGLLQIGTFLEYFDLMLYVHMAIFLNELFFPQTNPQTAALLSSLVFCSTYILRPLGALLFGYIGDTIGRKTTVILTTAMMSISCIIMANLPTYAQIGITAAWTMALCRAFQGLSSLGERIGAEIYLTETTPLPLRYPVVSLITVSSAVGAMAALGLATFTISSGWNWRFAFGFGAVIAIIGTAARTRLRETPDFVDMKRRIKRACLDIEEQKETQTIVPFKGNNTQNTSNQITTLGHFINSCTAPFCFFFTNAKAKNVLLKEKINKTTAAAYFLISCTTPLCFFFTYIHCGSLLKNTFGYSTAEIIHHNFMLSLVDIGGLTLFSILSYRINPLKLLYTRLTFFVPFILCLPFLLEHCQKPSVLFFVQCLMLIFSPTESPAVAIFLIHFPIFRRFTSTSMIHAITRILMYSLTSFGLTYLTSLLGHWGLLVIMIPLSFGFFWGVKHYEKLEKAEYIVREEFIAANTITRQAQS